MKPRLLDLCCGVGGAARGYQEAGFEVWGVDTEDQPRYAGDRFANDDAIHILESMFHPWPIWRIEDFDGIHASFPCQRWTAYNRRGEGVGEDYPDLIGKGRELLLATGLPYVVENVPGAPLESPIRLCGSSFGLDVRRHRHFETNFPVMAPPCNHSAQEPGRFPGATNRPNGRATVEVGVWRIPLETQKQAMGIDWDVTLPELSNAVPPAYTAHIGSYLLQHIESNQRAAA